MGDVDDCHARCRQPFDHAEELFGLVRRQRRGRLVEDEYGWVKGHGLGDFDDLLLRHSQIASARPDVNGDSQPRENLLGLCVGCRPVDESAPLRRPTEQDILGYGQPWHQTQFLIDHGDAIVKGVLRRAQRNRHSIAEDAPPAWGDRSG